MANTIQTADIQAEGEIAFTQRWVDMPYRVGDTVMVIVGDQQYPCVIDAIAENGSVTLRRKTDGEV